MFTIYLEIHFNQRNLKSWDNVKAIHQQGNQEIYRRARHAMTHLGGYQSLLEQYKTLSIKDLQLNKDITEGNQYYQMIPCLGFGWLGLKTRKLQMIGLQKVNLKMEYK